MSGATPSSRRHHVVSRGYLRAFAEGERTLLCDIERGAASLVGIRDVFVYARFNSFRTQLGWIDDLERDWARIESIVLPVVRGLVAGSVGRDDREAAKVLCALHTARSYSYHEVFGRIADAHAIDAPKEIAESEDVLRAFRGSHARDPEPGEIEATARELFIELLDDNSLLVERMANTYNTVLERFHPLFVQLLYPISPSVRLATGETPAVHFDRPALRVGLRSGLALFEADHFYMPLAPTIGMMLTTNEEDDEEMSPVVTRRMNSLVYRGAKRFVICHPSDDPARCFGKPFEVSRGT